MRAMPLYLRWLWWKHTWTFQAAHKPLCGRFHGDVIRLGSLRVCRSCAALYGSFLLALLASPLYIDALGMLAGATASGALMIVVAASHPAIYRRAPRVLRDGLRSTLGLLTGLCVVMLFSAAWPWGALQVAILGICRQLFQRQRDKHTRENDVCAGCAECGRGGICSGFAEQAVHLRAYEEEATEWLEGRGLPPA